MNSATNHQHLIVIPCLNEEHYIEDLVRSVVEDCRNLNVKIIIADGGSTDATPEHAKDLDQLYPNVVYMNNPKRIQSVAVNLAVAEHGKDAKYLIRLDAHAVYPNDYYEKLIEDAKIMSADSVVVAMDTRAYSGFQKAAAAAQNSKLGNGGSAHRNVDGQGEWVDHGHHALMSIEAFTSVGGYDENFSHNEDAELDIRLAKAGYKIWLTGKTSMGYYPRTTIGALFRQYRAFGKGRASTILKHSIRPKSRQMAPAAVLPAFVLALLSPISIIFALPLLAWAALCLFYGALIGLKQRSPMAMFSGIAAMTMHAGWSLGFWIKFLPALLNGNREYNEKASA